MTRRTLMTWVLAGSGAVMLAATSAPAQERARGNDRVQGIPPGHLPPPGECRVWYDGRPPGQQPPPTSCATARREAIRTGGRVIYGGGERRDDRFDRDDDRWEKECDEKDRAKGECDWRDERCEDRDRDGRCEYTEGRYPSSLPEMVWGIIFGRGERVTDVRRWVGTGGVRARYTDSNRDGVPEAVTWLDARGRAIQRWIDDNGDGRADRVGIYQNGRIVRVIR